MDNPGAGPATAVAVASADAAATLATTDVARPGPRLFATPADEPRARRASDVLVLVGAVFVLVLSSAFAVPSPGFARALTRLLFALPGFLDGVWQFALDLFAVLGVVLVLAAALRRRWSIVRDLVLAVGVAMVVWVFVGRIVGDEWPDVWDALRAAETPPWFPTPRVALPGAVVLTASPHLTLPMRRVGRWLLAFAVVAVTALGAAMPLGAISGALVAVIAAAAIHLVFGSSAGRPGLGQVENALRSLGVPTASLGAADRQETGLFLVDATTVDGEPLVVKVYGRDAYDSALVQTIWRTVWFREAGSPLRFRRLEQVEHEAFLTLFAGQAGIRTDRVVTAGTTVEDDALLVLRRTGTPLAEGAMRDDPVVLSRIWAAVQSLHRSRIAHGQLDDRHLVEVDGEIGIVGFRGAAVSATDTQLRTDQAQTLVTTALLGGEEAAVEAALSALGADDLAAVLQFLQSPALTPLQRRQVRETGLDLDGLRTRAADAVGAEPPPLRELRRITLGSIVKVVLPAVAILALISGLAGLDFSVLRTELRNASWWLILFGVLFTQVPRLTQAVSTLGASPVPLPLGPVYALQLAVSYVNIAIPTMAARIGVNIRFFQRHGVPAGTALAASGLDAFSGFIVQISMLVAMLVFTPASVDVDLDSAPGAAGRLLVLVVIVVAAAALIIVAVPRLRAMVFGFVRKFLLDGVEALRGLQSPRRLALLFGGNLATEVLFAVALGIFTRALGFDIPLGELLVINISVALLAGLMPVPGGIGVVEGALTYGLLRAGMPEESAFAAALMLRLSSFYLPPVWGYFALQWLERNKHL